MSDAPGRELPPVGAWDARPPHWPPPWGSPPGRGRWLADLVRSEALAGNPLGDPADRPLPVWLPAAYDDDPDRHWPTVYVLQGSTGQVDQWANRRAFQPTFLERVDRLAPPCLVVLVDGWTSLGGAQMLDSAAVGRYQTYLSADVVGHVDGRYRTAAEPAARAVVGTSSGGYAATVSALLHPEVWGSWASHAGDGLFEACYLPDVRAAVRTLWAEHGGDWGAFWTSVGVRGLLARDSDFPLLNLWAMAAAYSADPDGTVRLPFDEAGMLVPEVWQRWLAWDPVRMVRDERFAAAVASWRSVWVDAGTRDEFYLDLAARALAGGLEAAGLGGDRLRFELHGGRHGGQDERFLLSIGWLAERMAASRQE